MIDESRVREMLRRRAHAISASPSDPSRAVTRAERRVVWTSIASGLLVVVLFVSAIAGASVVRGESRPVDAPTPSPSPSPKPVSSAPDAIVTFSGDRCELNGGSVLVPPGTLQLEYFSESEREATFHVVRLAPGQTVEDLRADPPGPYFQGEWITQLHGPSDAAWSDPALWSSPKPITGGTWAVVCWMDTELSTNGFVIESAGVAGPIEVGYAADNLDATITSTGSDCQLSDVDGPIAGGILRLELVNQSRHDGMFTFVRLAPGQTPADLSWTASWGRWQTYLDKARRKMWASPKEVASGSWAVTCWKDVIPSPNGIQMYPIEIVGPLVVR
jgi:hypothetical protein